jgi:hypothetical protein
MDKRKIASRTTELTAEIACYDAKRSPDELFRVTSKATDMRYEAERVLIGVWELPTRAGLFQLDLCTSSSFVPMLRICDVNARVEVVHCIGDYDRTGDNLEGLIEVASRIEEPVHLLIAHDGRGIIGEMSSDGGCDTTGDDTSSLECRAGLNRNFAYAEKRGIRKCTLHWTQQTGLKWFANVNAETNDLNGSDSRDECHFQASLCWSCKLDMTMTTHLFMTRNHNASSPGSLFQSLSCITCHPTL